DPRRYRCAAESALGRRSGRLLYQHRAGFLMAMLETFPRLRRALRVTAAASAVLALLLILLFGALQLDWTRDEIRRQLAAATAGSDTAITIGEISGILPFDVALS